MIATAATKSSGPTSRRIVVAGRAISNPPAACNRRAARFPECTPEVVVWATGLMTFSRRPCGIRWALLGGRLTRGCRTVDAADLDGRERAWSEHPTTHLAFGRPNA